MKLKIQFSSNRLENYIGIMYSLNESTFDKELEEDIKGLKQNISDDNAELKCLKFPLETFILKLIENLYSYKDAQINKEKINKES